jgi:uncharacterized membrane protein YhaH (DUF805 family)
MTIGTALFSFRGRMSRSDFWVKGVIPLTLIELVISAFVPSENSKYFYPVALVLGIILSWPNLAIPIKRIHDRDHSAWFLATVLIPIAGVVFWVWMLIELWFLRGTVGRNRFGEDPLGSEYVAEVLVDKQKISG